MPSGPGAAGRNATPSTGDCGSRLSSAVIDHRITTGNGVAVARHLHDARSGAVRARLELAAVEHEVDHPGVARAELRGIRRAPRGRRGAARLHCLRISGSGPGQPARPPRARSPRHASGHIVAKAGAPCEPGRAGRRNDERASSRMPPLARTRWARSENAHSGAWKGHARLPSARGCPSARSPGLHFASQQGPTRAPDRR